MTTYVWNTSTRYGCSYPRTAARNHKRNRACTIYSQMTRAHVDVRQPMCATAKLAGDLTVTQINLVRKKSAKGYMLDRGRGPDAPPCRL